MPKRNVILFVGDGLSMAHRTAARMLSKGLVEGRYGGELGGPVFKRVMTYALQAREVPPTGTLLVERFSASAPLPSKNAVTKSEAL